MTLDETTSQQLREAFLWQARHCRDLDSPFVADLCELCAEKFADTEATRDLLSLWPGDLNFIASAMALRFVGALHSLVLQNMDSQLASVFPAAAGIGKEKLWVAVEKAANTHGDYIRRFIESAPQTNEVRRSALLLPGFLTIADLTQLPFSVSEIGASAGLNLFWDEFFYDFGEFTWGDPHASVRIDCKWSGAIPPLQNIAVPDRAACDLAPIDVHNPDSELRLLSYVWADQRQRFQRIQAAIEFVKSKNLKVETADALTWLRQRCAATKNNTVHVVYHSIVWQYLPEATQQGITNLLQDAGAKVSSSNPLAWLRVEPDGEDPGARMALTVWPGGETNYLGRADYHGRWVDWFGTGK